MSDHLKWMLEESVLIFSRRSAELILAIGIRPWRFLPC
jgi:hypothetical protein